MDKFSILILAAGKGKRMNNPSMAKVMALLSGIPLIGHVFEQVSKLNPDNTYLIVGYQKESVIEYVTSLNQNNIFFVEQTEQLGTGHAVAQAETYFNGKKESILILSGDVPLLSHFTLNRFIKEHNDNKSDLSVLSTYATTPSGYGRIIRDDSGDFNKIVEEKDADESEKKVIEINSGVYLVESSLLFSSLKEVKNNNAQGEYYLTDIISILRNKGANVFAFPLAKFEELQGINSPDDLAKAEKYYFSQH